MQLSYRLLRSYNSYETGVKKTHLSALDLLSLRTLGEKNYGLVINSVTKYNQWL